VAHEPCARTRFVARSVPVLQLDDNGGRRIVIATEQHDIRPAGGRRKAILDYCFSVVAKVQVEPLQRLMTQHAREGRK